MRVCAGPRRCTASRCHRMRTLATSHRRPSPLAAQRSYSTGLRRRKPTPKTLSSSSGTKRRRRLRRRRRLSVRRLSRYREGHHRTGGRPGPKPWMPRRRRLRDGRCPCHRRLLRATPVSVRTVSFL
ncbi:unnamed protein product [Ixodes pacificus]